MTKLQLKILCCHPENQQNYECEFIKEGDTGDYWFRCPKCKREVGFILKLVEEKK